MRVGFGQLDGRWGQVLVVSCLYTPVSAAWERRCLTAHREAPFFGGLLKSFPLPSSPNLIVVGFVPWFVVWMGTGRICDLPSVWWIGRTDVSDYLAFPICAQTSFRGALCCSLVQQ